MGDNAGWINGFCGVFYWHEAVRPAAYGLVFRRTNKHISRSLLLNLNCKSESQTREVASRKNETGRTEVPHGYECSKCVRYSFTN